jgi:hypothetical protein
MLQTPSTAGVALWAPRTNALLGMLLIATVATLSACKPGAPAPASESTVPVENVPAANAPDTKPQPGAAVAPAAAPTPASAADALIGKVVPPYPDGLDEIQGGCVPGGAGLDHACDFGLALLGKRVDGAEPSMRYLIASSNTDTAADKPRWQISDAIDTPKVDAGYSLQTAGCRLDHAAAGAGAGVVAVVRHADAEYSSDVTWARRFDIGTGKFSEIPLARVDCVNQGYGL